MRTALAFALAALVVVASYPPPAHAEPVIRIMPLGDSITAGYILNMPNDLLAVGYRKPLYEALMRDGYAIDFVGSSRLGVGVFPDPDQEGHGGLPLESFLQLAPGWVKDAHPDVILFMAGTNNIQIPPLGVDENPKLLEQTLAAIGDAAPTATTLVSTIPPILPTKNNAGVRNNAGVQAYNDVMPGVVARRQAAGQRVRLVTLGNIDIGADGVHPTELGYQQIATSWMRALPAVLDPSLCTLPISVQPVRVSEGVLRVAVRARAPSVPILGFRLGTSSGVMPATDTSVSAATVAFTLRRTSAHISATQAFMVGDACGDWASFVGGGPGSF